MTERTVQVGDVFYASWGYDQTTVNFFGVVAVSKTGKTATFVELTKDRAAGDRVAAGRAAKCRHCLNGVRPLARVDGSTVWRHVGSGALECKFYGYRAERLAEEGRVLHADVDLMKRRVRPQHYSDGLAANWNDHTSMYLDADGARSHYETPAGAGH